MIKCSASSLRGAFGFVAFFLFILLVACSPPTLVDLSVCEGFEGQSWPASYTGGLAGQGYIQLGNFDRQSGKARVEIVVSQDFRADVEADRKEIIRVLGEGTCHDSQIVVHFGANAGQNEIFRVLGGEMVGVFDPPAEFRPYGVWKIQLVHLESLEIHDLSGYWSIHTEPSER